MASALPQPENHRPHEGAEEIRDPEVDDGNNLGLDGFANADDDGGLALDQLSNASTIWSINSIIGSLSN